VYGDHQIEINFTGYEYHLVEAIRVDESTPTPITLNELLSGSYSLPETEPEVVSILAPAYTSIHKPTLVRAKTEGEEATYLWEESENGITWVSTGFTTPNKLESVYTYSGEASTVFLRFTVTNDAGSDTSIKSISIK
jgi:hypothetical protein